MSMRFYDTALAYGSAAHHTDFNAPNWAIEITGTPRALGVRSVLLAKGYEVGQSADAGTFWLEYDATSSPGSLTVGFRDSGGTDRTASEAVDLTPGRYYTTTGVWNGTTLTLYRASRQGPGTSGDSVLTSVATLSPGAVTPATNTSALTIGGALTSAGVPIRAANWDITEVKYFNNDQTKGTFDGFLAQRMQGDETDLTACWRADELRGGTVYDLTGNNHDLTLQNRAHMVGGEPADLVYPTGVRARCLIGYRNAVWRPSVAITASDEDTSYPASALRSPRAAKVTRTVDASGTKTWVLDLGVRAPAVDVFSLRNHNYSSTATLLLEMHTADSWGAPAFSQVITFSPDDIDQILPRPMQLRYARFSATDTSLSFHELGILALWQCWESAQDTHAETVTIDDPSTGLRFPHGHREPRKLAKGRSIGFSLADLPSGQAYELARILGDTSEVWVCPDPKRRLKEWGVYGRLTSAGAQTFSDRTGLRREVTLEVVGDRA